MVVFKVEDMSCGHCVGAITKAVHEVDAQAKVEVTLEQKKVAIDSQQDAAKFAAAIEDAGYTPQAA